MVVQMVAHKEGYQSQSQVVLLYQEAQMGVMTVVLKRALHLEVQEVVLAAVVEEYLQLHCDSCCEYHHRDFEMKVNLSRLSLLG